MYNNHVLNLYRNKQKEELTRQFVSGFPFKKTPRHSSIKFHGFAGTCCIYWLVDDTPVRNNARF